MEQNRAMLAERGERLQQLDERTAAMQNDAEDFASLAKQLADMQVGGAAAVGLRWGSLRQGVVGWPPARNRRSPPAPPRVQANRKWWQL